MAHFYTTMLWCVSISAVERSRLEEAEEEQKRKLGPHNTIRCLVRTATKHNNAPIMSYLCCIFLATAALSFSYFVYRGLCCNRSRLEEAEGERDQAVEAVAELSSKTGSMEEQLQGLGRLLKEAQDRALDKAQQLQHAEVCFYRIDLESTGTIGHGCHCAQCPALCPPLAYFS